MSACSLLSLATAVPDYVLSQQDAKALARQAFGGKPALFDRLAGTFDNAGIDTRNLVAPPDWYLGDHGWKERGAVYAEAADRLFLEAAQKALDEAGLKADAIDGIVTVSTTGIVTPSLEARCAERIGFRDDVVRVPVFGLGCAGGVSGLALAARLAAQSPGSHWLLVCVETCSISIRLDAVDSAAIVATALFGDGAAAAVLGPDGGGFGQVVGHAERMWGDTLEIMGWRVEDPGLGVVFDRAIPPFIERELAPAVRTLLGSMPASAAAYDRPCCHPGGAKVVDAIENALELDRGVLATEREVLRGHGNMSAPTVLFVLDRLRRQVGPERLLLLAFGPGFTCAGLRLDLR